MADRKYQTSTCERVAWATERVQSNEPVPPHVVRSLLPHLRDNDGVYEFLQLLCKSYLRCPGDDLGMHDASSTCSACADGMDEKLPVPLPELVDAVLACSNRDCSFVFFHDAWSVDGTASMALEKICSPPVISKHRVSYLAALTSYHHVDDLPAPAVLWVMHAIKHYSGMPIAPQGIRSVAADLLYMALDHLEPGCVSLSDILRLAPHAAIPAFRIMQKLPSSVLMPEFPAILAISTAFIDSSRKRKASRKHIMILLTHLARTQALMLWSDDVTRCGIIPELIRCKSYRLEEVTCLREMLDASGSAPAELGPYINEALACYGDCAGGYTPSDVAAIRVLMTLAQKHVPKSDLPVAHVVALAECVPDSAARLMRSMPAFDLVPFFEAIAHRTRTIRPCEMHLLLHDLSRDYPMEMASVITASDGCLYLLNYLHPNCLWLMPMDVVKLAHRGMPRPAQVLMEDDTEDAVKRGIFTYSCLVAGYTAKIYDVVPLIYESLAVVDKHTLAFHLATETYTGDHIELLQELDSEWPDIMTTLLKKVDTLEVPVTRARLWIRRRPWLLAVHGARPAQRGGQCPRPSTLPSFGILARCTDVVRMVASYL